MVISGGTSITEEQISHLRPAFADNLGGYRSCFAADATAGHYETPCRGVFSDLPRKWAESIALASGTDERTLQSFISGSKFEHGLALEPLQREVPGESVSIPADDLKRCRTAGIPDDVAFRQKWKICGPSL